MKKIILFISLVGLCIGSQANDGSLDPSFGNGLGYVDTSVNSIFGFSDAIQIDGKIVVLGSNEGGATITRRFNSNGTIDTTFGINGIIVDTTGISASDVLIQPDGKIIIAGTDSTRENFQLIRYNSNGSVDTSFGTNGIVTGPSGVGNSMALQTDSKIVLVGTDNSTGLFQVARYNPNGTLDIVFETGPGVFALNLVIQNDGKIIVCGNTAPGFDLTLVRYNTDGTLDPSFVQGAAPNGIWEGMVLQPDGKVIVAGNAVAHPIPEIARFNTDGSLDTTFGGGVVIGPESVVNGLLLQADGKSIIVGQPTFDGPFFQLIRYTPTGVLDSTFGLNGIVQTPPGIVAFNGALQSNGRIIAVGSNPAFDALQVARYLNQPVLSPTQIQSMTKTADGILLTGIAQNPSKVYVFQKGTLLGGTTTNPDGTNTWSFLAPDPTSGFSAISIYMNGRVNISSDRMWLQCPS